MIKQELLLIIGRDNSSKDRPLIQSLIKELEQGQRRRVVVYEGKLESWENLSRVFGSYPRPIGKIIKGFRLLIHPSCWPYFFSSYRKKIQSHSFRVQELKEFLTQTIVSHDIIILSRSAGGRISSFLADEMGIKKLVCIAYPFKHPESDEEPDRFRHLATLKTPFLIFQGTRDPYGGSEVIQKYQFSESIKLNFIDTDHDFILADSDWIKMIKTINNFIH